MAEQKRLPEKIENKAVTRNRTAEDKALIHRYSKARKDKPARFEFENKSNNKISIVPEEDDIELVQAKMFHAFETSPDELQHYFYH